MDAYLPISDTVKPCVTASANDLPWHLLSGTQTLFWYSTPTPRVGAALSSMHQQSRTTFVIVDQPAHQGLERLRTFRGWGENWDAEGGKAPDPTVIDFASQVLGLLSIHRAPEVTLNADGQPMFVYGKPLNGEITVTAPGTIDYFFADDNAPEGEDVAMIDGSLPQSLISYLHSAA